MFYAFHWATAAVDLPHSQTPDYGGGAFTPASFGCVGNYHWETSPERRGICVSFTLCFFCVAFFFNCTVTSVVEFCNPCCIFFLCSFPVGQRGHSLPYD